MISFLVLSIVLVLVIILLLFYSLCFGAKTSEEHKQMYAKLPSLTKSYLDEFKLGFDQATLKPRGLY